MHWIVRSATSALAAGLAMAPGGVHAAVERIPGPFSERGIQYPVSNGGFESSMIDWNGGSTITIQTNQVFDGLRSAGMVDPSFSANGPGVAWRNTATTISNQVDAGVEYVLSGYVWQNLQGGNASLDLNDVTWECQATANKACESLWQFVSCTFTPTVSATVEPRIVVDGIIPLGSSAYFDQISVTRASTFVAPTSMSEDLDCDGVPDPAGGETGTGDEGTTGEVDSSTTASAEGESSTSGTPNPTTGEETDAGDGSAESTTGSTSAAATDAGTTSSPPPQSSGSPFPTGGSHGFSGGEDAPTVSCACDASAAPAAPWAFPGLALWRRRRAQRRPRTV